MEEIKRISFNKVTTLILLIVATSLGSCNNLSETDVAELLLFTDSPSPQLIPPTLSSNSSNGWWEVYFTDPLNINDPENWQDSIEGRLIDKINSAQTSIHIASFEFNLTPIADALVAANHRGVEVLWVTDDEYGLEADEEPGHGQFAILRDAGIEIKTDNRSTLMHNKFWIFDGQAVWTGSTNITVNGIFKQDNNVIYIRSTRLASIYEAEFQEMWEGEFGPSSPSQMHDQFFTLNGSDSIVIFTSEDGALEQVIIPLVYDAEKNIRFMAFSYTDYPLAAAMIERAENGVDVAGVFESFGSSTDAAELRTLFCADVPVRRDGNPSFLHHKVIIIDESLVITGSLNFSTNAETNNDENVIVIDNPEIAALFIQEFDRVWAQASDPEPDKFPCE